MTDPLLRATAALREKYDATSPEGDPATRARVLEAAPLRARERRLGRAFLLPIAAAFVLFATWAAATGRLPGLSRWQEPTETVEAPASNSTPMPVSSSANRAPVLVAATVDAEPPSEDAGEIEAVTPAPIPSGVASTVKAANASSSAPVGVVPSARPSAPPAITLSDEDARYAVAHRAHFESRDWPRALEAWDVYLAKHPRGRLAPEARYNRALCLLRLGQVARAREALAPFADGREGGYRRAEAEKLLGTFADGGP